MIGVIANSAEHSAICEFFELFKTPWEFYRPGRQYDVLLNTSGDFVYLDAAKLVLIYAGQEIQLDADLKIRTSRKRASTSSLSYKGFPIPIYGSSITFEEGECEILVDASSHGPAIHLRRHRGSVLGRIGYDLFGEIAVLLTAGQPVENAATPTLDLHIALLRDLIVESGATLVEIPPVPEGYQFIACLTHDIDHPSIRAHKFDHTIFGFLYRAVFGSLFGVLRGRSSLRNLLGNWQAALKLLPVYMGLAGDFWRTLHEYVRLEKGLRSTFFAIPFKNYRGRISKGMAPRLRSSRYGAIDIGDDLRDLISCGSEVGVHGIDAWLDASSGQKELEEIRHVIAAEKTIGVRMHWLYFNEQSPVALEKAGFDYDSTIGYNETVGYRAGTSQVYKPLNASRLLELPLHIMDTSLFSPGRMHLAPAEAKERVDAIVANAVEFGGTVTINWHDRSIAPERSWGEFYLSLLEDLKSRGAWFSTASQAVTWFRRRRAVSFESVKRDFNAQYLQTSLDSGDDLPNLCLRTFNATEGSEQTASRPFRDKVS
jgi:hypothetical protein